MTTLTEYAHRIFPNHRIRELDGDAPLHHRTVVAQVIGGDADMDPMVAALRADHPGEQVLELHVEPTAPSVVNTGGEDPEAVVDLPRRRPIASALAVGVVVGVAVGLIVGFASSTAAGVIVGLFVGVIGAWVGAMVGGGGRFAGQRAWNTPQAPDQTIVLVAALLDDEPSAVAAADTMSRFRAEDVRIVDETGGWHLPNSYEPTDT